MGKKGPLWWRESDWLLRGSSAANQILLRHSGPILSHNSGIHGINLAKRYQYETFVIVGETKFFTLIGKFYQSIRSISVNTSQSITFFSSDMTGP